MKIRHLLYILIFIFFTTLFIFSQPVQQEWVATYTNPYNQSASVSAMAIDSNGNIYITGAMNRTDNQSENYITIKYNTLGVQKWVIEYNGPGSNSNDGAIAIALDKRGNAYVTGQSEQSGLMTFAFCTIKYDTNGIQQWVARYKYNPGGEDNPSAIEIDDSGNVFITGTSDNFNYYGGSDYCTIKYNKNGDSVWVRRFNGGTFPYFENDNYSRSLCIDRSGNVYVTGMVYSLNHYACTLKYDKNGNLMWSDTLRSYVSSSGNKIVLDSNTNNIYVCGGYNGNYLLIKYNSNGARQWIKTYYNGSGTLLDLVLDNNQKIFVAGTSYFNYRDHYTILKYNSDGSQVWVNNFDRNSSGSGGFPKLAIDKYSSAYITGSFWNSNNYQFSNLKYSTNGDSLWFMTHSGGGVSILIDKYLNAYVTGQSNITTDIITIKYSQVDGIKPISNEIPNSISLYQNYPNPFNPTTKIKFDLPFPSEGGVMNVTLTIFDLLGREVATLVNEQLKPGKYEVEFDGSKLSSGVYFYKLIASDFVETRKMVVVK